LGAAGGIINHIRRPHTRAGYYGEIIMPTTFTMRIDESQKTLISEYAAVQGKSMTEFMLEAALNAIEDATDLRDWKEAKAEFDKEPVTYSNDEIMREFGLR
jgi:hypothetical protein